LKLGRELDAARDNMKALARKSTAREGFAAKDAKPMAPAATSARCRRDQPRAAAHGA
jgi:hypothetical protein